MPCKIKWDLPFGEGFLKGSSGKGSTRVTSTLFGLDDRFEMVTTGASRVFKSSEFERGKGGIAGSVFSFWIWKEVRRPTDRNPCFGTPPVADGVGIDELLLRCLRSITCVVVDATDGAVGFRGVDVEGGAPLALLFGCFGPKGSMFRNERSLLVPAMLTPGPDAEVGVTDPFPLALEETGAGL